MCVWGEKWYIGDWSTDSQRTEQRGKAGTGPWSHDNWVLLRKITLFSSLRQAWAARTPFRDYCAPSNICCLKSLTAQGRKNRSGVYWFFFCCLESRMIHRGQVRFINWAHRKILFLKVTELDTTKAEKRNRSPWRAKTILHQNYPTFQIYVSFIFSLETLTVFKLIYT